MTQKQAFSETISPTFRFDTILGAVAVLPVLDAMHRHPEELKTAPLAMYTASHPDYLQKLHELWANNRKLLAPVLKVIGQEALSCECLRKVLPVIKKSNMSELINLCLTDQHKFPLRPPAKDLPRYTRLRLTPEGFCLRCVGHEYKDMEISEIRNFLSDLDLQGKVLCWDFISNSKQLLREVQKARCDYICTAQTEYFTGLDIWACTSRLPLDNKPDCTNFTASADLCCSGIRAIHTANGITEQKILLISDWMNFAAFLADTNIEKYMEKHDVQLNDREYDVRRRYMMTQLISAYRTAGVQSVIAVGSIFSKADTEEITGMKVTGYISSLPAIHEEKHLLMLSSLLQQRLNEEYVWRLDVISTAPDTGLLQDNRWKLSDNVMQAGKLVDKILTEVIAMFPDSPNKPDKKKLRQFLISCDKFCEPAMHILQAYYTGDSTYILQDKQLKKAGFLSA